MRDSVLLGEHRVQFIEELRRLNGTPEAVLQNAELMKLMLPLLRADFEVCEKYIFSQEHPFDCSISAFGGEQDEFTNHDELSNWRKHTKSRFKLRMFPGGHFFLHKEQALLLQAINSDLVEL